jgi:glycosyltransferase involved in cell wall biosynthesis
VDPERYPLLTRPNRRGLTTLVVAAATPRKNIDACIEAWERAFADDPEARLVIKSRFGWCPQVPRDPRISVVDSNETTPGIRHWYARADVVLALGGEGFGLPLIEGMACGLPVVALDAQGQHDTVAAAPDCLCAVPAAAWVPYDDGTYAVGLRAVPDVAAAADALTWVREHPTEARAMGRRASAWVHRHRNIWDMGPRMVDAMRRHLHDGEELVLADPADRYAHEIHRGTDPAFLAAH